MTYRDGDIHVLTPKDVRALKSGGVSYDFNLPDQNLEAVSGWTRLDGPVGAAAVRSNMVASIAGESAYVITDLGSANHWVSATVRSYVASPGMFIACRVANSQTWVGMITNSGTGGCEVWRRVGGVYTALMPATSPPSIGDTIRLEVSGTTWTAKKNGVQIGTGAIGDASLTSTRQGMIATSSQNPAFDNFQAGTLPPTVLTTFSDTFNRADSSLESSAVSSSGLLWIHDGAIAGAISISSNAPRSNTSDSTGSAYSTGALGSLDHYVQFKVTSASVGNGTGTFFCTRMSDRSNFVGIRAGNAGGGAGAVEVFRRVSGSLTNRYTGPAGTCVANDVLKLECIGTNLNVYKNGGLLQGPIAIGDGGVLTSQTAGIVARAITGEFGDDFEAGKL